MQVNPVISAEAASDLRQDIFKIGVSLCVFMPLCSVLATIFLFTYSSASGVADAEVTESFLKSDLYNLYSVLVSIIPIAVCIVILLIAFKRRFSLLMLKPAVSLKKFLAITALGMISIMLGSNVSAITVSLMELFNLKISEVAAPQGALQTAVYLLVYVILAPITEEILFRGLILERLRRYGDVFAILSSAMMFSLMHASLQSFPSAFISGVFFALISIFSGSPLSSMIVHAVNNALSILSLIIANNVSEAAASVFLMLCINLLAGLSIIAFFTIRAKSRHTLSLSFSGEVISRKRKAGILFFSFSMIIFIVMTVVSAISAAV